MFFMSGQGGRQGGRGGLPVAGSKGGRERENGCHTGFTSVFAGRRRLGCWGGL